MQVKFEEYYISEFPDFPPLLAQIIIDDEKYFAAWADCGLHKNEKDEEYEWDQYLITPFDEQTVQDLRDNKTTLLKVFTDNQNTQMLTWPAQCEQPTVEDFQKELISEHVGDRTIGNLFDDITRDEQC